MCVKAHIPYGSMDLQLEGFVVRPLYFKTALQWIWYKVGSRGNTCSECRFLILFLASLGFDALRVFLPHLEEYVSIQFEELEEQGAMAMESIYNFFDTLPAFFLML